MTRHLIALAGALAIGTLTGCDNTAEGMKKDAQINGKNAEQAADEARSKADEAGKDMGAAVNLTPMIKSAIVADPSLNDPANQIDVDSSDEAVTLSGHVKSAELKSLAGDIAERAVKEKGGKQKVDNRLEVRPS
ncbi:MAG: BON domain-containing protein [Armatimonadetes bacterium]|nr:BON domain-containing protein [Armatimonadota bacterium]